MSGRAHFSSAIGQQEAAEIAMRMWPHIREVQFIKGAVESRDPFVSEEVEKRRKKFRRTMHPQFLRESLVGTLPSEVPLGRPS